MGCQPSGSYFFQRTIALVGHKRRCVKLQSSLGPPSSQTRNRAPTYPQLSTPLARTLAGHSPRCRHCERSPSSQTPCLQRRPDPRHQASRPCRGLRSRSRIMEGVPNSLTGSINNAVIRRLADAQSYQRGLAYSSHGHVESLEDRDESVRAVVRGNQDYTVTLAADEGVLDYSCDCPVGSDGNFCKHCVAVALAWLKRAAAPA